MTYGLLKRRVLEMLDQHSVAGETISPAYNNQSDYEQRIPGLVNAALVEIRGQYPRRAVAELSGGTRRGHLTEYALPQNFKSLCTGGVYAGSERTPTNEYRLFGANHILVPGDGRTYFVEYWRKPESLTIDENNPKDKTEIDEDDDAIEAAVAYAAAWLTLNDDSFNHTALKNLYEDKLIRMAPPVTAEYRAAGYGDAAVWYDCDCGVW